MNSRIITYEKSRTCIKRLFYFLKEASNDYLVCLNIFFMSLSTILGNILEKILIKIKTIAQVFNQGLMMSVLLDKIFNKNVKHPVVNSNVIKEWIKVYLFLVSVILHAPFYNLSYEYMCDMIIVRYVVKSIARSFFMLLKEFSEKTGLSRETLRFYERETLLVPKRNAKNYRVYSEDEYSQVQFLLKMKKTGMKLEEIKKYTYLQNTGSNTIEERLSILKKHKELLYDKQKELTDTIEFVNQKIDHYVELMETK